jgi:hypothetical protein
MIPAFSRHTRKPAMKEKESFCITNALLWFRITSPYILVHRLKVGDLLISYRIPRMIAPLRRPPVNPAAVPVAI